MANDVHKAILDEGVLAWNRWRKANPTVRPSLNRVDLTGRTLTQVNLRNALLRGAKLKGARLAKADLTGADLEGARAQGMFAPGINLTDANLRQVEFQNATLQWAILTGARFRRARLTGADLSHAMLNGTRISKTEITGANFSKAILYETQFIDLNLSKALNVETMDHRGPSVIDHRTLYRSHDLSISFLRGAGVPEPFIIQMKSLITAMSPIEFYSCFISYSSKDQDFAERLYADLQGKGVRCWFAAEDLKIGDKLRYSFDKAIQMQDKLMVLLSEHSVQSPWVEKEVETAFEKERLQKRTVLFPIRLDDAVMETDQAWAADIRRTRHIGDFRNWKDHDSYKKSFERLLRGLKAEG
jgi:uncharacterized protein YjbI with pentapeptide repeats